MSSLKHASLTELFLYFFKLSWTAFGGPLAYISMMEDDCVEKRKWIGKEEFAEMLGVTNMLPGPNAAEMAIHIGYVKGGLAGAILSGLGFVTPSFIIILFLSWLYFQYHTVPAVGGIFYGINPVVVAIVLVTAYRLGRSSLTLSAAEAGRGGEGSGALNMGTLRRGMPIGVVAHPLLLRWNEVGA